MGGGNARAGRTAPEAGAGGGLHPRNPHAAGYDFAALVAVEPGLAAHVGRNPSGRPTIDFAYPEAVRLLNRALLRHHYGVAHWELPSGYLCPPVPGRADYVHHLADLLGPVDGARLLEIGVGAGCIHPILGRRAYGWSFVATDIDPEALDSTRRIVAANALLRGAVECRLQAEPLRLFRGVVRPGERFAASLCNPPFHASRREAEAGTVRKLRHLAGRTLPRRTAALLNFGGREHELICPGGELGFVRRMIAESAAFPELCGWFTCLVAKSAHLPAIEEAARRAGVAELRIVPMAQGQKRSRFVAWRFQAGSALRAGGPRPAG